MKKYMWLAVVFIATGLVMTGCKPAKKATKTGETAKAAASEETTAKKSGGEGGSGQGVVNSPVTFKYLAGDEDVSSVNVAGEFNGWNPSDDAYAMQDLDGDGVWEITVELDPGTYKYKYVIDGNWVKSMEEIEDMIEPKPKEYVDDGFGGKNAVIEVQ